MESSEIINIVRRALGKIDSRLIDHGERVGFIASNIYEVIPNKSDFDFSKLFVLCALHDIGAYKTEEIDDMVCFETVTPVDHSLYGYLFLKNTSHLSEYAEAILYHHTDYSELVKMNVSYSGYAEIIHLADRADILLNSANPDLSMLKKLSGTKFNPVYVDALFRAEEKNAFSERITSEKFLPAVEECLSRLDVKSPEVMEYLKLLVYAIDFRSPYTVTHTTDTTLISLELGKLLGLCEHDLQFLYIDAFLHDIGKIAIPYRVLEKQGRLTDEETVIIRQHINEGEAILRGVVNDEICDIALRHHEKLDGSGYSRGLTADMLTQPQRIVAVADIVSALSQERSYKKPFSKDKVVSILSDMKERGLICPLTVDAVCESYDMILKKAGTSHDPIKGLYKNILSEFSDLRRKFAGKADYR